MELIVGAFSEAEDGDGIGIDLGPCIMASPGGLCPYCKGEATEETEAPTIVDTCELVDP